MVVLMSKIKLNDRYGYVGVQEIRINGIMIIFGLDNEIFYDF